MLGLPKTMRMIAYDDSGTAEGLSVARRPIPTLKSNEVLLKVAAAGINRPDILQRQGLYPPPSGASDILGLEASGEVVACGEKVNRWQLGDSVLALLNGGGYAEYVAVPQTQCLAMPQSYDYIYAAALPETLFTVWHNVFQRAKLEEGQSLLVHGGASGIGTLAIQLGVAMGARVFVTASTAEKCRVCQDLGAELAINYTQENFLEVCKAHTQGKGVDVILDMVGADTIERNIKLAAMDGCIVMIAFLSGAQVNLHLAPIMLKRLTLTGSTLRAQTVKQKARIASQIRRKVFPFLESGQIKPYVHKVFPFEDVTEAHRLMENNAHIGKLVLSLKT